MHQINSLMKKITQLKTLANLTLIQQFVCTMVEAQPPASPVTLQIASRFTNTTSMLRVLLMADLNAKSNPITLKRLPKKREQANTILPQWQKQPNIYQPDWQAAKYRRQRLFKPYPLTIRFR